MINEMIKQVSEFHDAFGVKRGNVDVKLRYDLFKEEFDEYKDAKDLVERTDAIVDMLYIACGTLDVHGWSYGMNHHLDNLDNEADCLYFIQSELDDYLHYGSDESMEILIIYILDLAVHNNIYYILPELFNEVHASNMSKRDKNGNPIINDGILDPRKPIGKVLKSDLFFEPKLKEILERYERIK